MLNRSSISHPDSYPLQEKGMHLYLTNFPEMPQGVRSCMLVMVSSRPQKAEALGTSGIEAWSSHLAANEEQAGLSQVLGVSIP